MAAILDFTHPPPRRIREDELWADTMPMKRERVLVERRCPPCDRRCVQGRDCPAREVEDDDTPPMTWRQALALLGFTAGAWCVVYLIASRLAALGSLVLGWMS